MRRIIQCFVFLVSTGLAATQTPNFVDFAVGFPAVNGCEIAGRGFYSNQAGTGCGPTFWWEDANGKTGGTECLSDRNRIGEWFGRFGEKSVCRISVPKNGIYKVFAWVNDCDGYDYHAAEHTVKVIHCSP